MRIKDVLQDDEGNAQMCEVLSKILSDKRIYNAVFEVAVEKWGSRETKELYNDGISSLCDVPMNYLWSLLQEQT